MKKLALRIGSLILCLILCIPYITSCGNDSVYELGPYSIDEEEYAYLMGMYKKKILVSIGLNESYLNYPISASSSKTYGQQIEEMYRDTFEQSVLALLYSQALFDEYELELTTDQKNNVSATAKAIVHAYGDFSESKFNKLARDYGFSAKTLEKIYEKQAKESAVIQYLYGDKYSKLTDIQKQDYFEENYVHFQVIVVNTLYEKVTDSQGKASYHNLGDESRKTMLQYDEELYQLFVKENKDYDYVLLKDRLDKSFEDFWADETINDDKTYPNGYYMKMPENATQVQKQTLLTTACLLKEGDVGRITAERFFEGNGQITTADGKETVKAGDSFEYGHAFVKRLPMDKTAWKNPENAQFLEDTGFLAAVAQSCFVDELDKYDQGTMYTLVASDSLKEEYTFSTVLANELDYHYFYGDKSNTEESTVDSKQ